jgi:hypothetical protein
MKELHSQESTKRTGVKYAQFSLIDVSNALVDLGVLNLLLLLAPTRDPELLVTFNIVALVLTNANNHLWNPCGPLGVRPVRTLSR